MPRRPAIITQATVARAIRAARQEGASAIEVKPDGSIIVRLTPLSPADTQEQVEPEREIVL